MAGRDPDLDFPTCCGYCPYRDTTTGSCEHDSRQALVGSLASGETCPAYSEAKSEAMRELSASLGGSDHSVP
jgi:hypothetical protein